MRLLEDCEAACLLPYRLQYLLNRCTKGTEILSEERMAQRSCRQSSEPYQRFPYRCRQPFPPRAFPFLIQCNDMRQPGHHRLYRSFHLELRLCTAVKNPVPIEPRHRKRKRLRADDNDRARLQRLWRTFVFFPTHGDSVCPLNK